MKGKKPAFSNTSTGYGRQRHGNGKVNGNQQSSSSKASKDKDSKLNKDKQEQPQQDKDLNSGFGDYLRTPEAFEMMKLFVFANTIVVILTMAWPNIKVQYYWFNEWWQNL